MTTESPAPRSFGGWHPALGAAIWMALFGIAPMHTIADQPAATAAVSRVADVSLANLDLSTPEGMRAARERLQTMAQRVCAEPAHSRGLPTQPNFIACVDSTVAGALGQINALKQTNTTIRQSVTRAATVSLADLDLSTPEGSRTAHERLEATARRLCAELGRSSVLPYQPNWAACVHDALVGALTGTELLAAAKNTRTARGTAP